MKRHVKSSKYEDDVEEVELLKSNPQYAHVRLSNGRETTVSLRHLAPHGGSQSNVENNNDDSSIPLSIEQPSTDPSISEPVLEPIITAEPPAEIIPPLRKSSRIRNPPERLDL